MQDSPDAVEIRAEVVLLVLHDLGSHVIGTSAMAIRIVLLLKITFAKPKIPDIEMTLDIDQNILWLRYK